MRSDDYDEFAKILDDTYDLIGVGDGKRISAGAKVLFFKSLSAYPLVNVRQAIGAHIKDPARGKFTPKPADIIDKIETAHKDNRPDADEAWAIALNSQDEAVTVVWTQETAAAFNACRPVLDVGDEIGARMAFKAAYKRLTDTAKAERRPAVWTVSEGWDKTMKSAAIQKAEVAGLLLAPERARIGTTVEVTPDNKARAQLGTLRTMIDDMQAEKELRRELLAQQERDETAAAKQHQADLAANYQEKP